MVEFAKVMVVTTWQVELETIVLAIKVFETNDSLEGVF